MRLYVCIVFCCAWLLVACGSPIVGAECRKGWIACDGVCAALRDDPDNCGACGHSCGIHECNAGSCGTNLRHDDAGVLGDSGAGDAGMDGSTSSMPGIGKGGIGSPFLPDSGFTLPDAGCGIGQTDCGGVCVDTRTDRMHCGACGTGCGAEQYCIDGVCEDACTAPLRLCGGQCVDFATDENNCGRCGHVCASGICTMGECADVTPGSVVVIGHDYNATTGTIKAAMKTLAANAVSLGRGSVIIYRGSAKAAQYQGVLDAINSDGAQRDKLVVAAGRVTTALLNAKAFVIMPQPGTSDAALQALGTRWGLALSQFAYRGGVIVLFETATASNTGTYHVLEPSGLFSASGRAAIPNQTLTLVAPGDSVAPAVTPTYAVHGGTVHFLDVPSVGTVVVQDNAGKAVVFHRVISP